MVTDHVRLLAEKIWDYTSDRDPLQKVDCAMVLCSHDIRIADFAATIVLDGWAETLIFSGGLSAFTAKIYPKPEAQVFADVAIAAGVPAEKIVLEDKSTNTGENFRFTDELLKKMRLSFYSFLLIQKPNMLRRVRATALKMWPDKKVMMASHNIAFQDAPHQYVTEEMFIHELVGDLHRIIIYPKKGFQIYQEVPEAVRAAYEDLIRLGFGKNLAS